MDIEELKLILDTVRDVSGDIQVFAIWWLVLKEVLPIVGLLATLGIILRIVRVTLSAFMSGDLNDGTLREIRDLLGIGCLGPLTPPEREEVLRTVRRLHQEEQERKAEQKRRAEDLKSFTTPRGDLL